MGVNALSPQAYDVGYISKGYITLNT